VLCHAGIVLGQSSWCCCPAWWHTHRICDPTLKSCAASNSVSLTCLYSRSSLKVTVFWYVKPGIYPQYEGDKLFLTVSNLAVGRLSSRGIWPGVANSVPIHPLVNIVQYDVGWRLRGYTVSYASPELTSRWTSTRLHTMTSRKISRPCKGIEGIWGTGGTLPHILNLNTGWDKW
jgi:hypothetical protein